MRTWITDVPVYQGIINHPLSLLLAPRLTHPSRVGEVLQAARKDKRWHDNLSFLFYGSG